MLGGNERGVSSENVFGSFSVAPYTNVDDLKTMWRTGEPGAPAAANRFIVPMTSISWSARAGTSVESTTRNVCKMVSTWVAFTILLRIE